MGQAGSSDCTCAPPCRTGVKPHRSEDDAPPQTSTGRPRPGHRQSHRARNPGQHREGHGAPGSAASGEAQVWKRRARKGGHAARLGLGMARRGAPGSPLRGTDPPQESGFYDDRGSHTGAGDWREHRNVQRPECGSAPAPSVSVPRAVGDVVDRGSDAEPSRGQIGTLGCRTVAESKSELRGHGHLRCRVHDADGRRRGGADRRRQHLPQPAFTPRRPARAGTQLFDRRSRAAATAGPDQSSLLASAIRRLARCARRDPRAQRLSFPDHRHPPC